MQRMIHFSQLCALKKEWRPVPSYSTGTSLASGLSLQPSAGGAGSSTASSCQETLELRKIKKVQSFFRGWLCRRRWKQIVEQYIKSPHAESMRKRNRYKSVSYKFFTLGIWRSVPSAVLFIVKLDEKIITYIRFEMKWKGVVLSSLKWLC